MGAAAMILAGCGVAIASAGLIIVLAEAFKVAPVNGWLKRWWLTIPEPRDLSLMWAAAYVALFATGTATIIAPPVTVVEVYSEPALAAVGGLLAVGALLAMWGGWREFWKLERLGIAAMIGGTAIYGAIILGLQLEGDGYRWTTLGYVLWAFVTLGIRYAMIWRFSYRPRG